MEEKMIFEVGNYPIPMVIRFYRTNAYFYLQQ